LQNISEKLTLTFEAVIVGLDIELKIHSSNFNLQVF